MKLIRRLNYYGNRRDYLCYMILMLSKLIDSFLTLLSLGLLEFGIHEYLFKILYIDRWKNEL